MKSSQSAKFETLLETLPAREGQLAVDVMEMEKEIVIRSAIAGVQPDDLKIELAHDAVTIRGSRHDDRSLSNCTHHFRECFWGDFSRSIILPAHIRPEKSTAKFKNGVLTLILPKATETSHLPIRLELSV